MSLARRRMLGNPTETEIGKVETLSALLMRLSLDLLLHLASRPIALFHRAWPCSISGGILGRRLACFENFARVEMWSAF